MRIATSTNLCGSAVGRQERYTWREAIDKVASAGFEAVDICFCDYERPGQPLSREDWRDWARELREYAQEKNLPIGQGHAHYYSSVAFHKFTPLELEAHEAKVFRDIEAAGICGVKWLVIHPDSYNDDVWYSRKRSLEGNRERFLRYGEAASKWGVGIAIENLIDVRPVGRFAGTTEDLVELVDLLGDDQLFGICLDTGHANLTQMNQPAAIRSMGKRLKALHVNDNRGETDDHILPFTGNVQWRPLMEALGEIGYDGDFTYEIHNFGKNFEDGFHDPMMRFARDVAAYLVDMVINERKTK